jgi:hypothetical protein
MTTFNDIHSGDLAVYDSLTLNGVVTGNVTVHEGGELIVNGAVRGRLTVMEGAQADVTGVLAKGYNEPVGRLTIAVGANIGGRMLDDNGEWQAPGSSDIDDSTPRYLAREGGMLERI